MKTESSSNSGYKSSRSLAPVLVLMTMAALAATLAWKGYVNAPETPQSHACGSDTISRYMIPGCG